jgi:hypothetical protein
VIDQVGSRHFLACAGFRTHRCACCAVVHLVGEAALSRRIANKGSLLRHQDRVRTGGEIDAAYHAKYGRRYPGIVPAIVAPDARAATLKLVPR